MMRYFEYCRDAFWHITHRHSSACQCAWYHPSPRLPDPSPGPDRPPRCIRVRVMQSHVANTCLHVVAHQPHLIFQVIELSAAWFAAFSTITHLRLEARHLRSLALPCHDSLSPCGSVGNARSAAGGEVRKGEMAHRDRLSSLIQISRGQLR